MNDEQFAAALTAAENEHRTLMDSIAKRVEAHDGDTVQGKSGVQVLQGILRARGWDERDGQIQMTRYVDEAHDGKDDERQNVGVVAVVAPVGTGKTLGYLAPALARGERVVIATSTKALQDQIVGEELPRLREDMLNAFGKQITYTVMKGKSNYACLSHVDQTVARFAAQLGEFADADATGQGSGDAELDKLRIIGQQSRLAFARDDIVNFDADLALRDLLPDTQKSVTAKHSCPARKIDLNEHDVSELAASDADVWRAAYCKSMTADVVVMNTALLVEEVRKQNNKMNPAQASILEGVGMVVIDEAHHAPNIVTSAYSSTISRKEALKLAAAVDKRVDGSDFAAATKNFFDDVDHADEEISKRNAFHERVVVLVEGFVKEIASATAAQADAKSKKAESSLSDFRADVLDVIKDIGDLAGRKAKRGDKDVYSSRVSVDFTPDGNDFTLAAVPIDVSFFRDRLISAMKSLGTYSVPPTSTEKTVVLCSGTMNASVPRLLGFGGGHVMRTVESPFDPDRARLCVPAELPTPKSAEWESKAWEAAAKAMKATDGRTLFLCTSNRMVQAFYERAKNLPFPVMKQGDASRSELIRRFTEDENSVLIATMGYWEGIDVPGPALSLVIMDKTPFPVPTDAIATARKEWVKAEGGSAFSIVDCGHASTMLAQGAGRLIRSEGDTGGVLILDSRLSTQRYGASVLAQIDRRWLTYRSLEPFLGWQKEVAAAAVAGDPGRVLDYPKDAQPLRARRPGVGAKR